MQPSSHHYPGSWSWGHVAWGAWISQVCSKSSLTVAQTEFGERNILLPQGNTTRVMHIRHRNPSCHGHRIWRLPAYLVQGGVCLSFCSPSARTAQVLSSTECSNHRIENSLDPPAGWSDFRILSSPLGLYFSLWAVSTYPWISGLNQNLSFSQEDENSGKKKKKIASPFADGRLVIIWRLRELPEFIHQTNELDYMTATWSLSFWKVSLAFLS